MTEKKGDKISREGRTPANEMQLTAILSNVFRPDELDAIREDYWRTIRELRGEEE